MAKRTKKSQDKAPKESLEIYCKRNGRRPVPKLIVGEVMKQKGITYLEVARALGLAYPSNVSRLKTSQNLEFETLTKIAIALDVKVRDLIDE